MLGQFVSLYWFRLVLISNSINYKQFQNDICNVIINIISIIINITISIIVNIIISIL